MKKKFRLTIKENMDDEAEMTATFKIDKLVDDIYNEIVVRIADEIKGDLIEKIKSEMMKDKKLTQDLQEEIKQKLIEKMLPEEK